jgi:cytochrome c oxidase subunit 2
VTRERVLIVSAHPIFRDGIIRLLGDQAEVVGAASNWDEAKSIVPERRPQVIIIDHGDATLNEADLAPLLWPDAEDLRVIYVTLAGDKMTVHERHQVTGAGEADLLRALKGERADTLPTHQTVQLPQHSQGRMQRMEKGTPHAKRSYTRHFVIVSALVAIVGVISALVLMNLPKFPKASTQSHIVDGLLNLHFAVIGFLFALVMVFMLYSVIVFRRKAGDNSDGDHFEGNTKLEIAWTVLPLITVLIFGVIGAVTLGQVTAAQPNEMTVEVTAFSFGWQFSYPDLGIKNSPTLNLPVDQPVLLKMKSLDTDVLHNFYVPEFRVKQDLVPGVPTQLRITPDKIGAYKVRCNELCGTGHTYMLTDVFVTNRADFDAWAVQQQAAVTPEKMAERGAELVAASGCVACHNITGDPGGIGPTWKGLFGSTVTLADGATVTGDEEYILSSIINPNDQIHQGYNPGLMPQTYRDTFTDEQLDYLVEYIKTLK